MNRAIEQNVPRVSIGLPVYNGGDFLEKSVDSLLAQTFTDFELIICDNASTDNTDQICRSLCRKRCPHTLLSQPSQFGCSKELQSNCQAG